MTDDIFITTKEAAEIAGLAPVYVRQLAARGDIEGAYKVGEGNRASWYVPKTWAESYVKTAKGRPRLNK